MASNAHVPKTGQVLEGVWEDVAEDARRLNLNGHRVRIQVIAPPAQRAEGLPFHSQATPEEWSRALHDWAAGHDRSVPLLSDEAIGRESIYFGDRD